MKVSALPPPGCMADKLPGPLTRLTACCAVRWPTRALQQDEEGEAVATAEQHLLPPDIKWVAGAADCTKPHLLVSNYCCMDKQAVCQAAPAQRQCHSTNSVLMLLVLLLQVVAMSPASCALLNAAMGPDAQVSTTSCLRGWVSASLLHAPHTFFWPESP